MGDYEPEVYKKAWEIAMKAQNKGLEANRKLEGPRKTIRTFETACKAIGRASGLQEAVKHLMGGSPLPDSWLYGIKQSLWGYRDQLDGDETRTGGGQ